MRHTPAATLTRRLARWRGPWHRFLDQLERDDIRYLSHSQVSQYERCPRCYYQRYILGDDDTTRAMELGTAFHAVAERLYLSRGRRQSAATPSLSAFKRLSADERLKLQNALTLMRDQCWPEHEVVAVEQPFFLDLSPALPSVCGNVDLILKQGDRYVVVDHKSTTKPFSDRPSDQLILYAAHVRRQYGATRVSAYFDEYRLVRDLTTIRTPAFRRTRHDVGVRRLGALARRYARVWEAVQALDRDSAPEAGESCGCRWRGGWRL